MKKRVLLFVLLATTAISFSQSQLSSYKALINALGDGEKNTASELRAVFNAFAPSLYLKGDVKEIDCDNTYLALNFDNTGLGINDRAGWAICNGLNGTKDRNGRSSIGYGSSYTTIGATGGAKDAILVTHDHTASISNTTGTDYNKFVSQNGGTGGSTSSASGSGTISTSQTGESGTNKNYHPFIVTLFIQKL
ncbi:hypothetical protein QLS91_06360 [Flavobacterium sp. LB2P84]|uniref:hypothetical protein n=1 Tax=Flavobacterium yafengii TaxID=3041253 RepID=UPI0024A849E7|nr:hypothetical protein [Flavobacterium yafengii]MDI6032692.1 hypothetical protein [Flavobacterium yafengii]